MNRVGLAAAACALLPLTGCAGAYSDASHQLAPMSARPASAPDSGQPARSDNQRVVVDGLAITLLPPKSFTPTASAHPRAPRAVAFDLIIDNESPEDYQPSELSVAAFSNGLPAAQVIDSTQGYTGLVGADEVPPGQSLRISVAFAVPADPADVRLLVRPRVLDGGQVTLFDGTL